MAGRARDTCAGDSEDTLVCVPHLTPRRPLPRLAGGDGQQCPFKPPSLLPPADSTTPLSLPEYFRNRGIRIYGWETVPATEGSLLQALSNQPVVALVHASRDWFSYRGGLFAGSCSSAPNSANHAVLVVGYTASAWIIKNSVSAGRRCIFTLWHLFGTGSSSFSCPLPMPVLCSLQWGTGWGEGGYMYLPRGGRRGNPCGLLNMATYPVMEQSE